MKHSHTHKGVAHRVMLLDSLTNSFIITLESSCSSMV